MVPFFSLIKNIIILKIFNKSLYLQYLNRNWHCLYICSLHIELGVEWPCAQKQLSPV